MKKITLAISFLVALLFTGIYGRELYYINGLREQGAPESYVTQRAHGTFLYKNHSILGPKILKVK